MARELTRTKPAAETEEENGGLEQFATRRRVTKEVEAPVVAGWTADRRVEVAKGDRPARFKVPDNGDEILFAFLDETPFASFFQHWLPKKNGRAYTCLGKNCPLCARGDTPKPQDWFNVVELGDSPALKVWWCTADPAAAIKERADNRRTSPINKPGQYFAASKRTGKNGFPTYTIDVIKQDELEEDWGVKPLTDEQLAEFRTKAYGPDQVRVQTKAELQDVADEHLAD